MKEIIFHKIRVDIREFCDDCQEEITADNKSESFDNRCGYCADKFFTNGVINSWKFDRTITFNSVNN